MERPAVDLRKLLNYVDDITSTIGLILNVLLLYLIFKKTAMRLMDYRPILIQNCIIDIFFNFVNMIVKLVRFLLGVYNFG